MSEFYKEYSRTVAEKYFKKKTVIKQEEYDKLSEEEKQKFQIADDNYVMFENAAVEDHEIPALIQLKILEEISDMKRKVDSIRKILIFWNVLLIIVISILLISPTFH